MDRGVTDQELDNLVLAALVAICSDVLVLVSIGKAAAPVHRDKI